MWYINKYFLNAYGLCTVASFLETWQLHPPHNGNGQLVFDRSGHSKIFSCCLCFFLVKNFLTHAWRANPCFLCKVLWQHQKRNKQTSESCVINQTWCVIDIVSKNVVFRTPECQVLAFVQLMFVTWNPWVELFFLTLGYSHFALIIIDCQVTIFHESQKVVLNIVNQVEM